MGIAYFLWPQLFSLLLMESPVHFTLPVRFLCSITNRSNNVNWFIAEINEWTECVRLCTRAQQANNAGSKERPWYKARTRAAAAVGAAVGNVNRGDALRRDSQISLMLTAGHFFSLLLSLLCSCSVNVVDWMMMISGFWLSQWFIYIDGTIGGYLFAFIITSSH